VLTSQGPWSRSICHPFDSCPSFRSSSRAWRPPSRCHERCEIELVGTPEACTGSPPDGDPAYVGLDVRSTHIGLGHDPATSIGPGGQRFALWVNGERL
jgi:hypothetical protein